jgi:antitoxin MazE
MRVIRLGDELAVKLPEALVEKLSLKEGDEVELDVFRPHLTALGYPRISRKEALRLLSEGPRRPLPPGFKFDRNEANER